MCDSQDGWVNTEEDNSGTWYYYENGEVTTGWKYINGNWYYFNKPGGSMAFNKEVDGYFLGDDGRWVTDEKWVNTEEDNSGTWYYVGSDGKLVTGWNKIGDDFHYFNHPGGSMTWDNTIDGFQLDYDGNIVSGTGWLKDEYSGDWYYFSDGKMKSNDTEDGYHVDNSGKMVTGTGWKHVDSWWYYLDDTGKVVTGWLYDQGNWYFLYPQGSMAQDTWINGDYVDNDGRWESNKDDESGNSQRTSDVSDNDKIADGPTLKSRMQRLPGESKEYDPDTGVTFNPYTGEIDNISEQFAKLPGERLYYKIGESKKYFDPAIYDQFVVTNTSITDYRIDTEDPSGFTGYIGGTVSGGMLGSATLSLNIYFSYNKNTNEWTVSAGGSGGGGFIAGENLEAKAHIGFIDGNENSLDGAAIGTEAITPLVDAQIAVTPDNHHCVEVSVGPGIGLAYQENASYTQTFKLFTVGNFF